MQFNKKGIEPKFYNKNRYNDGNYLVLSRVIEEVTNKSYKKNFEDRISKPQHLNFTAFSIIQIFKHIWLRVIKGW